MYKLRLDYVRPFLECKCTISLFVYTVSDLHNYVRTWVYQAVHVYGVTQRETALN